MATTWDLYDSFNIPEASLAAKRSAYLSKASLLVRDRDPKIQGKYHGQKPDRIHFLLCRRPPRPSHTFSTEHKKCSTQGLSFYVHSALHSEWEIKSSVCFFFLDACLEFVVLSQDLEPTGLEFTEVLALRLSAAIKGIFIFYFLLT